VRDVDRDIAVQFNGTVYIQLEINGVSGAELGWDTTTICV